MLWLCRLFCFSCISLLFCHSVLAKPISIPKNIWASSSAEVLGTDFFSKNEVPSEFFKTLKTIRKVIPFDQNLSYSYQGVSIVGWLRKSLAQYNNKQSSDSAKIQLMVPEKITIHSSKKRLTAEALQERIRRRAQSNCESCEFSVTFPKENIPKYRGFSPWTLSQERDLWKGNQSITIEWDKKKFHLPVQVRWYDSVVTAKRNIPVGRPLKKQDVYVKRRDVTFLVADYLTSYDDITGMQVKKGLRLGQPISKKHLAPPKVIAYGQTIKASFSEGSFLISTSAQAKGAGAIGDRIPIEIIETGKKRMAEVVSEEQVRVY